MNAVELLWAIGRATIFTSVAVLAALVLLNGLKIRSPRIHRAAWLLAVLQGWLLVPWTWEIETAPVAVSAVSGLESSLAPIEVRTSVPRVETVVPEIETPISAIGPLVVTWLCGMGVVFVAGAIRYARFVRRIPRTAAAVDGAWQAEWERQRRAARVSQRVRLYLTADLGPLLCYVPFRHLVLAPRPLWTALTRRERGNILQHELAHLQRHDLWWSLAIRSLALVQWFNPLVWLAVRRFDEAGEWACDDLVSRGNRGRELAFARSLLAAAEYATTNSPGTAAAQGGELARRVQRLVSPRFKEEGMIRRFAVLVPFAVLAAVQSIRIEHVAAEEPIPPASANLAELSSREYSTSLQAPLPPYVIEPPDVLSIDAVKLIPKSPHKIEPLDALLVRVVGALPDRPISDAFAVNTEGNIDLGPTYGRIKVAGSTIEEAQQTIARQLKEVLQAPQVSVSLASSAGAQQIRGEHLVGPDGRVNLGVYGTVYVTGMTIEEARQAIERQLAKELVDPKVAVDVMAYNSKKYYVITRGTGRGDNVVQAPITGNDTILDALAAIGGVPQRSNRIWVARPAPNGVGAEQILPVNWEEISQGTSTATNYQLLPGDRLFVKDIDQPKEEVAQEYNFDIDVFADPDHELNEFVKKGGAAPFATFDSDTIRPTLRILAKHQLIKTIASPKLKCRAGQTAAVEMNAKGEGGSVADGLNLHLFAGEFDKGLMVQLQLNMDFNGKHITFKSPIPAQLGQTVLVPIGSSGWQAPYEDSTTLYVALTPSIEGGTPPAGTEYWYQLLPVPPTAE